MTEQTVDLEQLGTLAEAAGVEAVQMIMDAFWTSTNELIDQLRAAYDANDIETCKQAGHALKGSAANVGALLLADKARAVENAAREGALTGVSEILDHISAAVPETRQQIDGVLAKYA